MTNARTILLHCGGCSKTLPRNRIQAKIAFGMKQLGANLVAVEPGSYDLEAQRHKQFADLRQGNTELFRPGKALITHIATLQAG